MRIPRPILLAALLVAGFLYVTSGTRWDPSRLIRPAGKLWSEAAAAATTYTADEQNNIDIYKTGREATVNITSKVYRRDWFFQVYPETGTGSGFIIKPTGEILTNNHVVNGARELTVTLADKKIYKAKVLEIDPRADLALIKIDAGHPLPALSLGNSDTVVVGQKVLAIGNPFGFDGTLTTGVVSSLNRSIQTEESRQLEGMIQTDAAINPGNSGGPLLDSHGAVIGINTAIFSQTNVGIGFAMPVNRVKSMLQEIEKTGHVSQPSLGITSVTYVTGDLVEMLRRAGLLASNVPNEGGLLIQGIEQGSAAEVAGLHGPTRAVIVGNFMELAVGGDLITAVDGEPVTGTETLQRALNRKRGGDMLSLTVIRAGRTMKIDVKLGEAPRVL